MGKYRPPLGASLRGQGLPVFDGPALDTSEERLHAMQVEVPTIDLYGRADGVYLNKLTYEERAALIFRAWG